MAFVVACFCGGVFESLWGAPVCPSCGEMVPHVVSDAMDPQFQVPDPED